MAKLSSLLCTMLFALSVSSAPKKSTLEDCSLQFAIISNVDTIRTFCVSVLLNKQLTSSLSAGKLTSIEISSSFPISVLLRSELSNLSISYISLFKNVLACDVTARASAAPPSARSSAVYAFSSTEIPIPVSFVKDSALLSTSRFAIFQSSCARIWLNITTFPDANLEHIAAGKYGVFVFGSTSFCNAFKITLRGKTEKSIDSEFS